MAGRAGIVLRVLMIILATLLIAALALWGGGALFYRASAGGWLATGLGLLALIAISALWRGGPFLWSGLLPFVVAFGILLSWWSMIRPEAGRDWSPQLARTASVLREGERLTFRNVRHFRWAKAPAGGPDIGSGEAIAEARWEDRTVDLARVAGVDLFFSYWTGPNIAHVIVSFPFEDQPPLAFSIEIRRERGESYSALAGFFKSYELAIVAADERDIIRLRTDVWDEDVRLYRLGVGREKARALLLAYAAEINALAERPRWYHTLTDNCTTIAFRMARALWPDLKPDWRILVSGRAPEFAYAIGAVETRIPFAELQRKAAISARALALRNNADFSSVIRDGVPRPSID